MKFGQLSDVLLHEVFIEDEIKKVQEHQKILTEKEKELEKLATEKDWEEVDKDTNK